VHIHNAAGEHIRTTIDGEVIEPDTKLIESDRTDGPNGRTNGPDDGSDARAYAPAERAYEED
jgi:hypothetical protein